jgi:hypothetical protein
MTALISCPSMLRGKTATPTSAATAMAFPPARSMVLTTASAAVRLSR